MRKVTGEEITIKELKKCYVGYYEEADPCHTIEIIECNGCRYSMNEDCDTIICYPIEIESERFADYYKLNHVEQQEGITAYEFINNWWGLDDYDLESFTFYFLE